MDEIRTLFPADFPAQLSEIADPPKKLYLRGTLPPPEYKWLCVVGSRSFSPYAKEATQKLIAGLRGAPIAIVSGLALGIDAIAHSAALAAGLPTIAVPGSGLAWKNLYPRMNEPLARTIVESGGALLSEFEPEFSATTWSFPQRNRIMAGLSHATLIIEAGEKSGTVITARLAYEYNRDVLVVPHSIFSQHAAGSHRLLRQGAAPATCAEDILGTLNLQPTTDDPQQKNHEHLSEQEKKVVELLMNGAQEKDAVLAALNIPIRDANILLSAMEMNGIIKEELGTIVLA